jgi:predicted Zn-dependent protease
VIPNKSATIHAGLQEAIDLYRAGRLRDAISLMNKFSKRFPESAKVWGYLGFLNREADKPAAAARCFQHAVSLSPKSERASLGLFYTLCRLKRFDAALKEMGRFVLIAEPKAYLALIRGASSDVACAS